MNRAWGRADLPGILILAVLIGGPAFAEEKWKGTVVKEGDVTVVKNPKEPLYKTPVLELKEELALGGGEAEGDYAFGRVRHFVVDDAGAFYVLDQQNAHVKVFDASGKYLRTIGRKGQGPGELEQPMTLSINPTTGELAVHQSTRRMTYFKTDGAFLRHLSLKDMWALRGRVDSKGNIYITEGLVDPANSRYEFKKLGPDASVIAMLNKSPGPDVTKLNPFMAIGYWALDRNDTLVYGYSGSYEIQVFGPENLKVAKKIQRDYDPVAVTDEEREQERKDNPPSIKLDFPKFHAAYYRFFLSDQGHVLVQTWEKSAGGKYLHDIFDAEGRFISRVPLKPTGIEILKGKYYALEEDEDGYQIVKRYAVTWKVQ